MQPNHIILQTTPALHSWLGKKLSDKNVSQRQLAALLGRDNASVNRWLADKESIPPGLFLQAVSVAFPEESRAAEYLLHVHDRAKLLPGAAAKIVSSGGMEAALETARIIARRAEEAAAHFDDGNSALRYQFLSDYVGAGYSTLNMIRACHEENEPFINPTNVKIHLKFPHNVMTADLIQSARKHPQRLEEMSKKLMKSIAQTVKNREKGHESSYVRQHAFHMLARCGSDADSAMVLEMTASSKDLQTRRTGLYARIVNDAHPQAAEQFIYELEHEPDLAAVTLDFDLVHYGNKALYGPVDNKSLENVIVHNLRHIQSHQRAATAQIALRKLLDILFKYGARQFDRRRIYPPIKRIVEQFGSTHYSRLTNVEKKFLNHFHLLKPAFNPSETERVAGPDQLTFTFS